MAERCELRKASQLRVRKLEKVAEDVGGRITLQHLSVVEEEDGPAVIKN